MKKFGLALALLSVVGIIFAVGTYRYVLSTLPKLITVADYQPMLSSQVFDRNGKKIGEFYHERRILVPYSKIPKDLVNAFLAAEDDQFFHHGGVNYLAILRAAIANFRAGRSVQGGSTITQQVAKTLLLSSEKTILRKIKDILLAQEMEAHLSKEDILYLYLNQIYFGQGAHGIELAAETYFRKTVDKLTLPEMAILAGLPKAPSAYSPITNPVRAKERQGYVLRRMAEVGFITQAVADAAVKEPIKIYTKENFQERAPYFLETIRLLLNAQLGDDQILSKGFRIHTSLDLDKQLAAQDAMINNLKDLDKRQGYRGTKKNITEPTEVGAFLLQTRNALISDSSPERIIMPDGKFVEYGPLDINYDLKKGLPTYLKVGKTTEAVVSKIDDDLGLVYIRLAELEGVIDFDTMKWARKPDSEKRFDLDQIKKPSQALKMGDIILTKVVAPKFDATRVNRLLSQRDTPAKGKKAPPPSVKPDFSKYIGVELDQDPIVQASLISFDQETQDVLAMIGGTDYEKSEYNRALQAARQTGSSFKSIVYASALDHGYNPSTPIMDAPIVFEEQAKPDEEGQEADEKVWKPSNHSKSFGGDIIMRNALVKSLNIPSVKIIEDVKTEWAADYAKRLGIFSKLNMDFTLALGSSSVTLYEMTKVFSEFGRLGKRTRPVLIHKVLDANGKQIAGTLGLDIRFQKEQAEIEKSFDERRTNYLESLKNKTPEELEALKKEPMKTADRNFFFDDPDQLIRPTTAYLMVSLLKAVVEDKNGTGVRARAVGREVAGKTGTTNGYYDAWFIGFSPQIATGVWVGFDNERSLGKGEVGGRSALPIWIDYMRAAHESLPILSFSVPEGIVFANIDGDTGDLPAKGSKNIIRQAYLEGTEPTAAKGKKEEDSDFYKQDLSD
jgi:penicillin-binding protein 1A